MPTNCSAAKQLPQFYKHSKSADLLRKSLLSHVWRVPSSKALSCKHERLFDLLTLHHIIDHDKGSDCNTEAFGENHCHDFNAVHRTAETDCKTTANTGYHAAKQRAEQQIRAGKRRGNTDINRKDIRDQPCEKRVDRHRIDRIGSKKPAQFFQTDRNRGIFNNKRKKDRDRYGGVICSSNMEVPEIPLSYNLTGVRKIVIPKAFMIPATVSISRFTTRKFLGFCTPLFR